MSLAPIDRSDVAKSWHAQGFSCGLWIDHAGREWAYQTHDTDELFMLISGTVELEIGEQSIKPTVGMEIHIPAGMLYTIRNVGGNTARWFYGRQRNIEIKTRTTSTTPSRERSFYPELKRKRRIEKRIPTEGPKVL